MKGKNLTAKHAFKYNKATIFKDRKKALKKGDQKHKSRSIDRLSFCIHYLFLLALKN